MKAERSRIPLAKPIFDEEMKEAANYAMQNERFVLGESVYRFEEEFARYCGTKFAVSTGSGTAALVLSLLACDVKGREVVTSPASFIASANSIVHAGAAPKFADITLETYTMDQTKLRSSLSDRTKAVLPVHLYGFPSAMKEIGEVTSERGIRVIEDACQAHGATLNRKKAGAIGDVGCFSFYPSKNMTVGGDGGMMVTNDEVLADRVASLRDCGRIKGKKYLHNVVGFTERLNTIQAAIGRVQLRRLDSWNEMRRRVASKYDDLLSDLADVIRPPTANAAVRPVYHLYVIRTKRRNDLQEWLTRSGVETGIHYTQPIHLQPIYREMFGFREGQYPNSELLCQGALSIPMYPMLTMDEVKFVGDSIHEFYESEGIQ